MVVHKQTSQIINISSLSIKTIQSLMKEFTGMTISKEAAALMLNEVLNLIKIYSLACKKIAQKNNRKIIRKEILEIAKEIKYI